MQPRIHPVSERADPLSGGLTSAHSDDGLMVGVMAGSGNLPTLPIEHAAAAQRPFAPSACYRRCHCYYGLMRRPTLPNATNVGIPHSIGRTDRAWAIPALHPSPCHHATAPTPEVSPGAYTRLAWRCCLRQV